MEAKREQALVGVFVVVAAAILLGTVFALSGAFHSGDVTYRAYFKNAGGIGPGATVRYAGGPAVGRVAQVRSDPQDSTHMEITLHVNPETPVKADSVAKITSLGPLGENYLEITPGSAAAARAQSGSVLPSDEYISFGDLTEDISNLSPQLQSLLKNLNARVSELQDTIARVNDMLGPQNRSNLSATLSNTRRMLEEDRPKIHSTLGHLDDVSAKLGPMLDDFKKTMKKADDALAHVDETLQENRPELREVIKKARETLASASSATDQLDRSLNYNSANIDEILDNLRHITENMKEFTETIKTRPYTLIRSSGPAPRSPGQPEKP